VIDDKLHQAIQDEISPSEAHEILTESIASEREPEEAEPEAPPAQQASEQQQVDPADIDWTDQATQQQLAEEFQNSHYGQWAKDLQERIADYGVGSVSELTDRMRAEGDHDGAELMQGRYQELAALNSSVSAKILESGLKKLTDQFPRLRSAETQEVFKDYLLENGWSEADIGAAVAYKPHLVRDAYRAWSGSVAGRRSGIPKRLPRRTRRSEPAESEPSPATPGFSLPVLQRKRSEGSLTAREVQAEIFKMLQDGRL
jgi:hypothetical protein